jgi:hypothetical protein
MTNTYTTDDLRQDLETLEPFGQGALVSYTDPLWSEVLPGLWQGGTAADDEMYRGLGNRPHITTEDFDTVITMYAYANPVGWGVKELRYGFYDADVDSFDPESLFEVVKFAHAEWKAGKRVLIRCQAGWNRSGLVTALVLIRAGYTAAKAIRLIRERRSPDALCNQAFVEFLHDQSVGVWRAGSYARPKRTRAANRPIKA